MSTLQTALITFAGIVLVVAGIMWASNHSASKAQAVYESFAHNLSHGKLKEAYDVLDPNAKRGISFAQFKAVFGKMQPIITINMNPDSTQDKLFGTTFSTEGCESEYTMKVVNYMGEILVTRFNFQPFCGQ